jgi:tetratricopeptide (TPR) repeat protein
VIGELLGAYHLLSELGKGGMGTVYLAKDGDGSTVALKVVHPHLELTPSFRDRFLREAELGKRIRHENVVATYEAGAIEEEDRTTLFLAMEHVEGQTLRSLLDEIGQVPEELCRHIAIETAKALAAVHAAGAIHRDLKPENVLITRDHAVKLMDLGIARIVDETIGLSQTGAFVGSVRYGAPEQFEGVKLDGRTDLYALGILLYELSTGKHPFPGDDVATVVRKQLEEEARAPALLNPQLTPFFEEVVQTLLAKKRGKRFASAARLLDVLEEGEQADWWKTRAAEIRLTTQEPLRRVRIARETALHGRDEEMARLRALFEKATARQGHAVLVRGEAGIGKTRLVDEFVGLMRREGHELNFLFGSYPPGGAATAASAFLTAYREHFGVDSLEERLERYLTVTPSLIPAFAALLRGETTPKGEEPLTKDSLHAVFVHATRALAEERPTVVLIENLHFAPDGGLALFAALSLALPGDRILLVGTSRHGLPEDWAADIESAEHCSRITVGRLGPKDLAHLLLDAFGSERLASELGYQIGAKSDGNPFFVFEIIRGLREGQFISQQTDGTWIKTQVIENIEIPATVMDLIQARISDLDEDGRNLLEVASCCGYEFDPRLVGEVLGMARIPALQKLGRIEKSHHLIRSAGHVYLFDHHQVQEALYEGLSAPLRQEYHAALADALEGGDHRDTCTGALAVELCRHLFRAARGARSLPYLGAALDHLEKDHSNDAAIELAERALAVPDLLTGRERIDLIFRVRSRFDLLSLRDRERTVLEEARDLADEIGDDALRSRARHELGQHHFRISSYDEARACFEESLARACAAGDRKLAGQATGSLGAIAFDRGEYDEARDHFVRSRDLARKTGDARGEATASGNLGIALLNLGRPDEAREHLERHLALAQEAGDRRGEAIATGNLGLVFSGLGDAAEADACFGRCLELSREIGFRQGEASATGNLGQILYARGRFEQARERYADHRALCEEIGDRRGGTIASGNLGITAMSLGRYAIALEHLEEFRDRSRAIGNQRGEAIAVEVLGRLLLQLGDAVGAKRNVEAALDLARASGARRPEGDALFACGACAEQWGELEDAARLYAESLEVRRAIGNRADEAAALAALGRIASDAEEADAHLDAALQLGHELGASGTIVCAAAQRALRSADRIPAALAALREHETRTSHAERIEARYALWQATQDRAHLEEAHRLLLALRDDAPEGYARTLLEEVALHRAITIAIGT